MNPTALDQFRLIGRTALVTGASGGIGHAIARALCEAGAKVYLGSRSESRLENAMSGWNFEAGSAEPWIVDLLDKRACENGIAKIMGETGSVDILVNCAGVITRGSIDEQDSACWNDVLGANLSAPYRLCRAVAPAMRSMGWGRILNIGSVLSVEGKRNALPYIVSKHGIAGLTRALAAELGPDKICVNALCPGYVRTDINTALQQDPEFNARIESSTPCGRWGTVEDIVGPALFLCSDAAAYVNGHLLLVDGGMTATH